MYFSANEESCENCISTRVCRNNTGTYLRFSKQFKSTLSMVPCDLVSHNNMHMVHSSIIEEVFVEICLNSSYSIRCPICDYEIYYEIPHIILLNVPYCAITVTGSYVFITVIQYVATKPSYIIFGKRRKQHEVDKCIYSGDHRLKTCVRILKCHGFL